MNPYQFLREIQTIPTGTGSGGGGDGYRRTENIRMLADIRTTAGLVLTGGTVPAVTALETNFYGLQQAASQTSLGEMTFYIPGDYDGESDQLYFSILANTAGSTDAPTFSGTLYFKRAGAALSAGIASNAATANYPASINKLAALAGVAHANFSGNKLLPGDAVTVQLTTSAHTTDAVNVYEIHYTYRSNLVLSNMAARGVPNA